MKHVTTINELNEEIAQGATLVDFYADWCGPCKMIAPILEALAPKVDFKIIKVNVDQAQEIAMEYQVMSIPTLIKFKDGEMVNKTVGFMPEEQIIEWMK